MTIDVVVPDEIVQAFEALKQAITRDGTNMTVAFSVGPVWIKEHNVSSLLDVIVASFGEWVARTKQSYEQRPPAATMRAEDNPRIAEVLNKIRVEREARRPQR